MVMLKKKRGRPSLGTEDMFHKFGGTPLRSNDGFDLYYARATVYVPVKEKHIKLAKPKSTLQCVMALACNDYFGRDRFAEVLASRVRIIDLKARKILTFSIPLALSRRLGLFDHKNMWDLPPELYRLGPMPKPTRRPKKKKHKATTVGIVENNHVINGKVPRKKKKKNLTASRFAHRGRIVWPNK